MPKLIRARDNHNAAIVEPGRGDLTSSYFNLVRLDAGQARTVDVPRCELVCVVLSGRADIAACAQEFKNIGRRADIWDGPADSVYCGTCPRVTVRALRDGTEVAIAGGECEQPFAPFRIPPEETDFEEIYHYRYRPENGFGAQFCYDGNGGDPTVMMTRHGDTFLIDRGYHPTVRSPGYEGYIFTILVGRQQRSLVQYFDPQHRSLMEKIPGIQAMRDKFR